jgi:hypothetical protein
MNNKKTESWQIGSCAAWLALQAACLIGQADQTAKLPASCIGHLSILSGEFDHLGDPKNMY